MYGFDKPITAYGLDKPVVRPAGNGGYYGRNEVDVRPPTRGTPVTAATSHNDADYREEYHVSGRHEYRTRYPHLSERDFEGAENLLLLSQPEERRHKDRRTKRTRRGSQY